MSEAPKEVWIGIAHGNNTGVDWSAEKVFVNDTPYTRTDIHKAVVAERDELKAENERLEGLLMELDGGHLI